MITVTLRLHTDAGLFCARLKGRHMDTIISIGLAAFGIDGAATLLVLKMLGCLQEVSSTLRQPSRPDKSSDSRGVFSSLHA